MKTYPSMTCRERIGRIQDKITVAVPPMHDDAHISTILAQASHAYYKGDIAKCLKLVKVAEMRTREQN